MHIEAQNNGLLSLQQTRRANERNVQSVFSDVLASVGREGYASADLASTEELSDSKITTAWNSWYQAELSGRYSRAANRHDLGQQFGDILVKAHDAQAYVDPKSFLSNLSKPELNAIQKVHWLADPVKVDALTEEGAINLLLPPAAQIDLNHDGLTQSGAGYMIRFPDSTTPREVVAAWDEATESIEPKDRMIYELQMKLPVLLSNIVTQPDGSFVRQREPGDADFQNPMAVNDYSFIDATKKRIDYLNAFKNQMDPLRVEKDLSFWNRFEGSLRASGAK